jgi:arsenate reductase (thioredoxin)
MEILILCTGNSCRSQMAEGILKSLDPTLQVFSAGVEPAEAVSRRAIKVMQEIGIDISAQHPKSVNQFLARSFDYVITVCDHANETCPVFSGVVKNREHLGFSDPTKYEGDSAEVLQEFRRVRDEIKEQFSKFYNTRVVPFRGL